MGRTVTTPQRNILKAARVHYYAKVEVENGSGTFIDYTTAGGQNWVIGGEIVEDIDNPTATATVRLRRGILPFSLAPMLEASDMNVDNFGAYSPAIDRGRGIRIAIAPLAPGSTPVSGDYIRLFEGRIDVVAAEQDPIVLECRDPGARLVDTLIGQSQDYGTGGGTALETVLQQIISDNLTVNTPTLVASPSPSTLFTTRRVDQQQLMDALRTISSEIGWDVRYRWSGATTLTLQLWEPDRAKTTPDWTVGPGEYLDVTRFALSDEGRRNGVEVYFTDSATGLRNVAAHYGPDYTADPRLIQIELDETSNIDSPLEAQDLADLIFSDLSIPKAEQEIRCTLLWFAQLADLGGFLANGVHYDTQQNLGVSGIRHTFENGHAETFLRCRGNPAGAYTNWLLRQRPTGKIPGEPEFISVTDPIPLYEGQKRIGWRISGAVDEETGAFVIYTKGGVTVDQTTPSVPVTATGADGEDETWVDTGTNQNFTITLLQDEGTLGEVVLIPHELMNPGDAHPRPGKVGKEWRKELSLYPITEARVIDVRSTVEKQIVITVRPASTSWVAYRIGDDPVPDPWTEPWIEVPPTADGRVVIGDGSATNPFLNVSGAPKRMEYYGFSEDGAIEPTKALRIDEDIQPNGVFTLSEVRPNYVRAEVVPDDDVLQYAIWDRFDASPVPTGATEPDDHYRLGIFPREARPGLIWVPVDGTVVHGLARFYDKNGAYSQSETSITVVGAGGGGPTDPAITAFIAYVSGASLSMGKIGLTWDLNPYLVANASSYKVRLLADGNEFVPLSAAHDPEWDDFGTVGAGSGSTAISAPLFDIGTPPGAGNIVEHTFTFVLELWNAAGTVLIHSYQTTFNCFLYDGEPIGGTAAPSGTPPVPTLTAGPPGSRRCSASWTTPTPDYRIRIVWEESDTIGGTYGAIAEPVLPAGTTHHQVTGSATGFIVPPVYVRAKSRYENGPTSNPLTGSYSAYSTPVLCEPRLGVV